MALQTKDFSVTAKSGHGKITYTYILRLTQHAVDPVKNCSQVTVEAILKQTYSGTAFSGYRTGVSCTVDGETLFSDYCRRTIAGREEHVFYTWEGEIPHRHDGSRVLNLGGKLWQTKKAEYTPPTMVIRSTVRFFIIRTGLGQQFPQGSSTDRDSILGMVSNSGEMAQSTSREVRGVSSE